MKNKLLSYRSRIGRAYRPGSFGLSTEDFQHYKIFYPTAYFEADMKIIIKGVR